CTTAGACRGCRSGQSGVAFARGWTGSVGTLAANSGLSSGVGGTQFRGSRQRSGTGKSGAVPGQSRGSVACGRSATDASGPGPARTGLANAEGPVRGGVAGDPAVVAGESRCHGEVVVRAAGTSLSRSLQHWAIAHVATAHPGEAAGDGTETGVWRLRREGR